jgi:hypothetical protein
MGHMSRACRGVRTRLGNRLYAEYEGVAWGAQSGEVVTLIGSSTSQGLWAEARRVRVLTCCIRGGTPRHVGQVRTALVRLGFSLRFGTSLFFNYGFGS